MKGIIYVWSQLNLIPMLTPVLLLPLLWILRSLFQAYLARINAAFVIFVILLLTSAGTYWVFEESPRAYAVYLLQRGLEIDAKVTSVVVAESVLTNERFDEVEFVYTDAEGVAFTETYVSKPRRFYPLLQKPIAPPAVGDKLRIRMLPEVAAGFIVLTDSKKSTYGEKLECNEARLVLKNAELNFRREDFTSRKLAGDYKAAIDRILPLDCITLNERDALREVRERLK